MLVAAASSMLVALAVAAPVVPPQEASPYEREVRVGGTTVRALCTDGPRRVLLVNGSDAGASTWLPVLDRLDGSLGACAYDRPSLPEGQGSRGWFELDDEMRRIHAALGFDAGYTLVGYSTGGLYARLFAAGHPGEVGGLVLVDPAHENFAEEARAGVPEEAWRRWMEARSLPNADGLTDARLADRARRASLPDIPVTVITAMARDVPDGWDERFVNEAARRVHASILSGLPLGRHVPARRSGHGVQLDDPDLVATEIRRVVSLAAFRNR